MSWWVACGGVHPPPGPVAGASKVRRTALGSSTRAKPATCSAPQIKDIGSGNFGVAKLMRDRSTGELVAVKFIERGEKVGVLECGLQTPEEEVVFAGRGADWGAESVGEPI